MFIFQNTDGSWTIRPFDDPLGPAMITAPNTDSNDAYRQGAVYVSNWQTVETIGPTGLAAIATTLNTGTTGLTGASIG